MMVLLAVSPISAMACPCEQQEPFDKIEQQKALNDTGTSNWSDPVSAKALIGQLSKAVDNADALFAGLPPDAQADVLEYLKVT